MKFRLILNTTTNKGHPVQIKFKVPPSKHLGLINFLKIALENDSDVELAIEKIDEGKSTLSKVHGMFKLAEESASSKTDE